MYPWGPGMMGYGYGASSWWGIVMLAFWAVVIAGIALLVVWLVRQSRGRQATADGDDRALTILRERFARGEIDAAQYEQMRRTLE
ncbi:MAG TPA: SHOCT domain-containing protein [Thermomicrobiaceae bacterium]|nr:SHOCT domain-containing protein [Thermomicrobiaceae bacterium]